MARLPGRPDGQELALNVSSPSLPLQVNIQSNIRFQVRPLRDVDLDSLKIQPFDGGSLGAPYQPPKDFPALKTEVDEGLKLYHGNCHCGAITWTVKHKSLEEAEVTACNCSWCRRASPTVSFLPRAIALPKSSELCILTLSQNGEMWIYPPPETLALRHGGAFTAYEFGSKRVRHLFCSTCGVSVGVSPKKEWEAEMPVRPVNVRTIIDVDLESLKVKKADGWSKMEPQYEVQ